MSKEYKHWNTEKKLIPVMIRTYCRGNHKTERKAEGVKGKELCSKCKELAEYAAFRLEKCPFKRNKGFCSYCKIHCYKPEYRAEMKEVMKYSGPKMLFSASDIRDVARNGNDKIQKAVKKTGKEAVGQKRGSGKGSVCADKRSKEGQGVSK